MTEIPPLLVKLLLMTTSSRDGEALTAMRKANALLAAANVNWAEFLTAVQSSGPLQQDQTFRTPPSQRKHKEASPEAAGPKQKYDDAAEIDPMFERAFANANGGFKDFLDSVHQWWEDKAFLTEKQFHAVKRAADAQR